MTKFRSLAGIALGALLAFAPAAEAHHAFLLPSATVFSGEDAWVTLDAAISNDLFFFEFFPMQLNGLVVTAPDGSTVAAENAARGRHRSTFDVHLQQTGTYRIAVVNDGLFASWRQNGEQHRWRGTREAFARDVPANAENLRVTQNRTRIEAFATRGRPDTRALQPTDAGLELVPVTHPNDLAAGSEARFRLQLDGKPAAGVEVSVIPGGNRYRDGLEEIKFRTAADGSFAVTWPKPGMYWIGASVRDDNSGQPGVGRNSSYAATLEVLP